MLGPIFTREWLTLPRRSRHYLHRAVFLGGLWILLLTVWQTTVGWTDEPTIGDQARFGLIAFQLLAYTQLGLLLFFSALSAASAIAQEKDRRTFVLLLLTDLRNYEIVLGKLMGSLLQIIIFVAGSVPVLALLLLLGGISWEQIADAALVLFTTGLAAGSLGALIALWRERTFQSLALTFLALVLYLCLVRALMFLPALLGWFMDEPPLDRAAIAVGQAWADPFTALALVLDPPQRWAGLPPARGFALVMLGWTAVLNLWGMFKLRAWNPSGEPRMEREQQTEEEAEMIDRARAHAAPGAVRLVWGNPILWREVATRAYGRRPILVKLAYFLVVGLVCYYALALAEPGAWAAARGLVPAAVLSLLLISAQAVTAITSERDIGALDLLMVTDLSPKEFVYGKLLGILWNTKEFLLPPLILAVIYAVRGQLASAPGHPELLPGKNLESLFCIVAGMLILIAFTTVLGLHVALRGDNSRLAVLHTLGTVFFLSVGTLICIYLILINGRFEYQWLSFSAFILAGVGGLLWVLSGDRPSTALTLASWACPFAVFYSVTNIMIGRPGTLQSTDPFMPFLVTGLAFGFALLAMLVPLVSEFDVAVGRTSAGGD